MLSLKAKILLGLFIFADVILITWGVIYRRNLNQDYALFSNFSTTNVVVPLATLDSPSFPTESDQVVGVDVFSSVSTGRVGNRVMYDRKTGEKLGTATTVEVVTLGRGEFFTPLTRIPLVVQFASNSEPSRNIMPWVLQTAAKQVLSQPTVISEVLTNEQVSQIFTRESVWNFATLINLDREVDFSQLVEYISYSQRYYGGLIYETPSLIKRISGRAWFPIVLDIAPLEKIPTQ